VTAPAIELRVILDTDLPTLFVHQADPEASEMAAFPSRTWDAFVEHEAKIRADPATITRTIVAHGEVIGSTASWQADGERAVGYWIGRAHWGKGMASAALRAFIHVDRTRPLSAHVAEHNVGSRRVLEKCGFVLAHEERGADGVLEQIFVLRPPA
jgi:RimJ/RimL family protein N-acetyltransferase